jgi:hypothetical protein
VISGNTLNQSGASATESDRWTATMSAQGLVITLTRTCGRGAGQQQTASYSASGSQLIVYTHGEGNDIQEITFLRQ